ncbi:MAG: glycoside hydrolase family 130 protein [Rhodothermales bacterium]
MSKYIPILVFLGLAAGCASPDAPADSQVDSGADSWTLGPFEKYAGNPILTPQGDTWEAKDIFNPAAWTDGETIYLIYRAEDSSGVGIWNGTSRIGLGTSTDGIRFDREPDPIFEPSDPWELPGGTEDPRIVHIDGTYYLTYTGYDGETARLGMATSTDLHTWTKHGPLFPERGWTKSGAILPEPIDGTYWMYFGDTNIWAAHSTDLLHWTVVEEPAIKPRPGMFDSRLVEPGPPPLLTDDGILLIYNSADENLQYAAGQALFDPRNPAVLIDRTDAPFLEVTNELEKSGQIANVVFAEGLVEKNGTWFLYYGMGDSGIGVATARVSR